MPTRDGDELRDAPSGKVLRTEENKNKNADFNIHEDKSVAATGAASDHDVRYARILEAIAHSASATREAITVSEATASDKVNQQGKGITDKLNQLTDQSDKLTDQFAKLQIAFEIGRAARRERGYGSV